MRSTFPGILIAGFIGLILLFKWINVLREYERAVTFWLGRLSREAKGPGLVLIFWPFETMVRISMRTVVHDVPTQDIITKDNVSVKVNAVVYFRVVDPNKAVVQVENYLYATSQLGADHAPERAGTGASRRAPLRAREAEPRASKGHRRAHEPVGRQSLARRGQAGGPAARDAARDGQAGRGGAGEAREDHPRAGRVPGGDAALRGGEIIGRQPATLQLRYLQTLTEIANEKNSTIVFPLPIELLKNFITK
jgi:regulator of protease activity HflC (stomatin/prohibitin superfamily)